MASWPITSPYRSSQFEFTEKNSITCTFAAWLSITPLYCASPSTVRMSASNLDSLSCAYQLKLESKSTGTVFGVQSQNIYDSSLWNHYPWNCVWEGMTSVLWWSGTLFTRANRASLSYTTDLSWRLDYLKNLSGLFWPLFFRTCDHRITCGLAPETRIPW